MSRRSPLRSTFIGRLRTKLYTYLKGISLFEGWSFQDLYPLARSIVESRMDEINEYLDSNQVTLEMVDKAVEEIIQKILIPEVRKMRV